MYYRQDSTIKEQIDYIDNLQNKVLYDYQKISECVEKMKIIDDRGGFQTDDEVGLIFKELEKTLIELEDEIKNDA